MKEQIAIILPCMNSMPFLKFAVENIFNSTQFNFKLLLIESESTDGTKEYCDNLAKEKNNVEVYQIPKKGLVNAYNFGIEKAGDLDVYLTQDDVIHFKLFGRDWLEEMYEVSQNKDIGLVTSMKGYGISGESYINGFRWVGTWSCYIPRRIINEIGMFDPNMGPGDDIDYSYRVAKLKKDIGIIDYWVQHHRLTNHGDGDRPETIKKMAEYFRKKHKLDGKDDKNE